MPRTIEIQAYKFDELSETAKQKVLEKFYDFNVDHDWWDCTYEDAKNVGLKITGFDLDRRRHCEGQNIDDCESIANRIIAEHGEDCETYKTAKAFLAELDEICQKFPEKLDDDGDNINTDDYEAAIEDANADFLKSIFEDYSIILQNEYEYLTSEAAIIESIEANEYEFDEHGKMI